MSLNWQDDGRDPNDPAITPGMVRAVWIAMERDLARAEAEMQEQMLGGNLS